ncbi:MAG: alginate export family protein [Bacteroidales bacterium]|nr:alginate export family protein [Bacteroidales bacterium]
MKKIYKISLMVACMSMIYTGLNAQDLIIDAELRPRVEFRDGFQKPLYDTQNPAIPVFQRSRLGFTFTSHRLDMKVTFQDARVWGQTNTESIHTGNFGLFEAWAGIWFGKYSTIRVGRQGLKYDNNRLFSLSSWTNYGKSHDLILYKFDNHDLGLKIDLGLAYNNPATIKNYALVYDVSKIYQEMSFLHLEKSLGKKGLKASAIFVQERFQEDVATSDDPLNYHRFTTGANLELNSKDNPFGFILTGYYQFRKGKITPGLGYPGDLSAYLLAANVRYRFCDAFGLNLGADVYSGTSADDNSGTSHTWQKLYGSNHSFNGSMEYWRDIKDYGLSDFYMTAFGNIAKNFSAQLCGHVFLTNNSYKYDAVNTLDAGSYLGAEVDIDFSWKVVKYVKCDFGYSYYFASDQTYQVKGMNPTSDYRYPQWAFVSLTINPELFNSRHFQKK